MAFGTSRATCQFVHKTTRHRVAIMNQIAQLFSATSLTRHALEMSSSATVVTDTGGTILFANQNVRHWFGYSESEITGRSLDGLLPEMRKRDQFAHSARPMSQGETTKLEMLPQRMLCKDGSEILVNVSLVEVQEQSQLLLLANMNRTEQETIDHQILESERLDAVTEMISGLAHESRNALQRAVACLDLLELDLEDDVKQMDLSQKIRRSLSDLLENYDEVRRFAEPVALNRQMTRLLPICVEAFDDVLKESHFAKHEISVAQRSAVDDVTSVDRNKIKEVFSHVLENAVDLPTSFARIVVDCASTKLQDRPALQITIHDDGDGFSQAALAQAFEPFYTTKQHGTGLGLSISRRLIQAHGGTMRVSNPAEGGALVTIVLPRVATS